MRLHGFMNFLRYMSALRVRIIVLLDAYQLLMLFVWVLTYN
jgi:hypothetical protein